MKHSDNSIFTTISDTVSISSITVPKGAVIVLTTKHRLSDSARRSVAEMFKSANLHAPVIVLEDGMGLHIVFDQNKPDN